MFYFLITKFFAQLKSPNIAKYILFFKIFNIAQIHKNFLVLNIILVLTDVASNSESLE